MKKKMCPYCNKALTEVHYCTSCQRDFSVEVKEELTDSQIAQQDRIDNACYDLIQEFEPGYQWDVEQVDIIRQALLDVLVLSCKQKQYDLYPWILEDEEGEDD